MKVYLATSGEYSDFRVRHVFAREEDARSYRLADDVEEYEVRDGPVEVRAWHELLWHARYPDRPGNSLRTPNPHEYTRLQDFDGNPGRAEHEWSGVHTLLRVGGWDLERVRKVYSEQRAKYLGGDRVMSLPADGTNEPWEASDGIRWLHFPTFGEWHGWQPGEDGLRVLSEAEFAQAYPEAPQGGGDE